MIKLIGFKQFDYQEGILDKHTFWEFMFTPDLRFRKEGIPLPCEDVSFVAYRLGSINYLRRIPVEPLFYKMKIIIKETKGCNNSFVFSYHSEES